MSGVVSGVGVWYKFGYYLNFVGLCVRKLCDINVVEMCVVFAAFVRYSRDEKLAVMSDLRYVCKCVEIIVRGDVDEIVVNVVMVLMVFVLSKRWEKILIVKVAAYKGGAYTVNARAD